MPANVAHMLICNKAVKVLQDGGQQQSGFGVIHKKVGQSKCGLEIAEFEIRI